MTGKSLRIHKTPAIDVDKLAKCIKLLASDREGEQTAAIAAIGRVLLAADKGFGDLAKAVMDGFAKPTKQRAPARWSPPVPDGDYWESMAWFSHYHRQHLSDRDKGYVRDVLMGLNFDCGRADSSMMRRLREIVAKIRAAQDADDRW
jgi:hypothetical protein